jgi:hypothetical protein
MPDKIISPAEYIPITGLAFGAEGVDATPVDRANLCRRGGHHARPSATFTRCGHDAYASGDLVANSTAAGRGGRPVIPRSDRRRGWGR